MERGTTDCRGVVARVIAVADSARRRVARRRPWPWGFGSLRATVVNGFGNGLNASQLKFEGEKSGELRASRDFAVFPSARGEVKVSGFASSELLQAK